MRPILRIFLEHGMPSAHRWVRAVLPVVLIVALVASCTSREPAARSSGEIDVVATFYPLAEAAERVGGEAVSVANLTPPGVEPHDLELSPEQLVAIAEADVVVMLGRGFQPAVEEAVEAEASGDVLDVLRAVGPAPPEASDPHAWLDPTIYASIVDEVGSALVTAGADADAVDRAEASFRNELDALDADFSSGLADCQSRTMITNHAAFSYLAARYDLRQEAISGIAPGAEPDPERLAELKEIVEAEGVTTIFTEELVSPEVAETLAGEAGVKTAALNPIEGLTAEQLEAGEDYVSTMRGNLDALRAGLGCR